MPRRGALERSLREKPAQSQHALDQWVISVMVAVTEATEAQHQVDHEHHHERVQLVGDGARSGQCLPKPLLEAKTLNNA